jgi:nitroreductase
VDAWLAVASRREVREYAERELPDEVARRILDAGRLAGSARNRQPWRFVVVESPERREALARAVYASANVRGARLVVAIVSGSGFDGGRCAQNMMLVAWNEGVGSCPNGAQDREAAAAALGLAEGEEVATVLTFGYPRGHRDPTRRSPEAWSERADRRTLDELVTRI